MTAKLFSALMWSIPNENKPPGCVCYLIEEDNAAGESVLIIDANCPIHSKYLATWQPGMCNVINLSTREVTP